MLQEKIESVRLGLASLGGTISEEAWIKVRACIAELDDAATQAEVLEQQFTPPAFGQTI